MKLIRYGVETWAFIYLKLNQYSAKMGTYLKLNLYGVEVGHIFEIKKSLMFDIHIFLQIKKMGFVTMWAYT